MIALADLYRDACAWGKYVMFEHGTIVRVCVHMHMRTQNYKLEFTRELAEWMVLNECSDEVACQYVHVAEICYKEACAEDSDNAHAYADAFWLLYFGTFDPSAQCVTNGNIHVSGGDMDVWLCDEANPYDCVELDRLFPHVVACFEVNEETKI